MKELIAKRIKATTNRLQLLTNTEADKQLKTTLLEQLRELQKEYQIFI